MFKYAIHITGLQLTGLKPLEILKKAATLDNNPKNWKFTKQPLWK